MWWAPLLTPGATMTLWELNFLFSLRPHREEKVPLEAPACLRGFLTFGCTFRMSTKSAFWGPEPCAPAPPPAAAGAAATAFASPCLTVQDAIESSPDAACEPCPMRVA